MVDFEKKSKYVFEDLIILMLESVLEYCEFLDLIDFICYCVFLKDFDLFKVIEVNCFFLECWFEVLLYFGVMEVGIFLEGVIKMWIVFE